MVSPWRLFSLQENLPYCSCTCVKIESLVACKPVGGFLLQISAKTKIACQLSGCHSLNPKLEWFYRKKIVATIHWDLNLGPRDVQSNVLPHNCVTSRARLWTMSGTSRSPSGRFSSASRWAGLSRCPEKKIGHNLFFKHILILPKNMKSYFEKNKTENNIFFA